MKITAMLCVRNELPYLQCVLPYLATEGIEVVLIDNGSTDGTLKAVHNGEFPNVVRVETFPYSGTFDLSRQLKIKWSLAEALTSDWLIHQDADEILHAPTGWGGFRHHIERADSAGFTVLNFNELVMLPADPSQDDILHNNRNYYFFEPKPMRLMRAWKRTAKVHAGTSGGHTLQGADVNVYPERMILKHFIVRNQDHAYEKYLGRSFSSADLGKGWHRNRLNFTAENLRIPTSAEHLHTLASPLDAPNPLPRSSRTHFWEWGTQA
jgi:glycosyltransferase involved in cell wall biosynthesis